MRSYLAGGLAGRRGRIASSLLLGASGEQLTSPPSSTAWPAGTTSASSKKREMLAPRLVAHQAGCRPGWSMPPVVRKLIVSRAGSWRRADHGGDVALAAFPDRGAQRCSSSGWSQAGQLVRPRRAGWRRTRFAPSSIRSRRRPPRSLGSRPPAPVPAPLLAPEAAKRLAARTDKPNLLSSWCSSRSATTRHQPGRGATHGRVVTRRTWSPGCARQPASPAPAPSCHTPRRACSRSSRARQPAMQIEIIQLRLAHAAAHRLPARLAVSALGWEERLLPERQRRSRIVPAWSSCGSRTPPAGRTWLASLGYLA